MALEFDHSLFMAESSQTYITSSFGFHLGFDHLRFSLALTMLIQKHLKRWGHSRGSAATESTVLAGERID